MRNEKKERKAKRKEKKRKEGTKRKEFVERKGRKGKGRIFRVSGGRRSTVRVLKLVHTVGSTCGHQKVGVSTNSKM